MVVAQTAGLRFFFVRTLKRRFPPDSIPYPKYSHHRTPRVLSPDEVAVEDIDSERMVMPIRKGKGGKDRDVPLCPRLLETLREYWRWKKPKTWLFPGQPRAHGEHLTDKAVWYACTEAAPYAGLKKRVSPHMLRHSFATRRRR